MASINDASATARVILTIDLDIRSNWGADCTIAQVEKQALDAAHGELKRMQSHYTIVGQPVVKTFIHTAEGKKR